MKLKKFTGYMFENPLKWVQVLVVVLLFILSLVTYHLSPASAQSNDDINQQLQDNQAQIDQLQQQLDQVRGQEKTLKSQLDYIDAQTKLTELKIQQTNYQIEKLTTEITDLDTRITRLSSSVDSISQLLLDRIVKTYKYENTNSGVDLLFSSHGFSDLLKQIEYIQVAQANDKKVLYQLQATKTTYNDQKSDKQSREEEQQKLKVQLDQYSQQLDQDKNTKAALLKISQNNEAIYQSKLQAALAEQAAIIGILGGGGNEVSDGPVHKGDIIGYFIPTASTCSSGPHLHFEVHQNGNLEDPNNYLANTSFSYVDNDGGADEGTINPHGSWDMWPIIGSIVITQGFGMTPYAKITGAYGPTGHTGIDMWSSATNSVRAVHDGTLSHGGIACNGGTLYYKRVDHGDGISSYYLHVL